MSFLLAKLIIVRFPFVILTKALGALTQLTRVAIFDTSDYFFKFEVGKPLNRRDYVHEDKELSSVGGYLHSLLSNRDYIPACSLSRSGKILTFLSLPYNVFFLLSSLQNYLTKMNEFIEISSVDMIIESILSQYTNLSMEDKIQLCNDMKMEGSFDSFGSLIPESTSEIAIMLSGIINWLSSCCV